MLAAASRLAFVGALVLLAFVAGDATDGARKLWKATDGLRQSMESPLRLGGRFVDVMAEDAAVRRVELLAPALAGPVLMTGGRHRFMDRCPGFVGCLAVEYDRHGRFVHAYPFRPDAYESALVPHGLAKPVAHEQPPGFEFAEHADVFAVDSYSNGDLAVVLHSELSFPTALGIARVDRDGRPRWFRADGSHHSPTVAHGRLRGLGAGLPDAVVAAGRQAGSQPMTHLAPFWEDALGRIPCGTYFVDYLHVIDGDGGLLGELAIAEALRDSRHAPMLAYTTNACDPLRLNSAVVLTAGGARDLAAGDFLVSLGGLGALAALDGRDGHLKGVWRGSFYGQRGARELDGPAGLSFLLFDNQGPEGEYGPGRLLAFDPRSGRERTIFPNASSRLGIRANADSGVSVAPDGSRAIMYADETGQALEVDLGTGDVTAIFRSLDDVSALQLAAGEMGRAFQWRMRDTRYIAGPPLSARR